MTLMYRPIREVSTTYAVLGCIYPLREKVEFLYYSMILLKNIRKCQESPFVSF